MQSMKRKRKMKGGEIWGYTYVGATSKDFLSGKGLWMMSKEEEKRGIWVSYFDCKFQ